jgi:hypothetical protein
MKRTALALTFMLTLLFSAVAGTQIVKLANANPIYIKPLYCRISIQSPQNITYSTEPIFLNFTVETNQGDFDAYPYFYLLDGERESLMVRMLFALPSVKVEEIQLIAQKRISDDFSPYERNTIPWEPYTEYTLRGQAVLPNLPDGEHNLTVFMGHDWVITNQTSANPTTNATLPDFLEKILEALHPNATSTELNQIRTQWANQIALNQEHAAAANEVVSFFATVDFSFETTPETSQEFQREPFPITLAATAAVSVAIVGVGLLVYFKKRNH